MSQPDLQAVTFNSQLSFEADRVLADVIFARAPIQRRLLRYLVQRAVAGDGPASQYEVAVDGLGRGEDYYLESDSYPRVQMSRLRRNLENYYARNLPGNGFKIALAPGSYCLDLAREQVLQTASEVERSEAPVLPVAAEKALQESASIGRVGLAALASIALLVVPYSLGGKQPAEPKPTLEKPSTALVFSTDQVLRNKQVAAELVETSRWIAKRQLSNSFVSKPLPAGKDASEADYMIDFNFGSERNDATTLFLSLADRDGDILYSNTVPFDPARPSAFANEIEASLVSITAPVGLIAEAELTGLQRWESSDYSCFLAVAGRRARGTQAEQLADTCIERYPGSEYRPFWLSRRAFIAFQAELLDGRPLHKSGPAWADLQAALEADRFNAFANVVAAKLELVQGNCDDARPYISRALEREGTYPALIAAVEARAASCLSDDSRAEILSERLQSLLEFNPNPDPFLQLYMVIGSLAANDRRLAHQVARRNALTDPQGAVEETVALLHRAFVDRTFAIENRQMIEQSIYAVVWNRDAASEMVEVVLRS